MKDLTLSHDTIEMANSYKYMVESFANFGVSVSRADAYVDVYLQHGSVSAIDTEIVGQALKDIWTKYADPDFDNFIKNFDIWGETMVEENNLAEDYKEKASATYVTADGDESNYLPLLAPSKDRDELVKSFGDGHGFVSEDEVKAFRYANGVRSDSSWNYYAADRWQERMKGSGATDYFNEFDKLSAERKAIVARRNSQKAQTIFDTYGKNNTSSAYFHVLDSLDPGEMAALNELLESK